MKYILKTYYFVPVDEQLNTFASIFFLKYFSQTQSILAKLVILYLHKLFQSNKIFWNLTNLSNMINQWFEIYIVGNKTQAILIVMGSSYTLCNFVRGTLLLNHWFLLNLMINKYRLKSTFGLLTSKIFIWPPNSF